MYINRDFNVSDLQFDHSVFGSHGWGSIVNWWVLQIKPASFRATIMQLYLLTYLLTYSCTLTGDRRFLVDKVRCMGAHPLCRTCNPARFIRLFIIKFLVTLLPMSFLRLPFQVLPYSFCPLSKVSTIFPKPTFQTHTFCWSVLRIKFNSLTLRRWLFLR